MPDGIDVYFENVGGPVTREVLRHVNLYARMPVCGLVADYNATSAPEGRDRLPGFMGLVLRKSLTVRGFIQGEFVQTHTAATSCVTCPAGSRTAPCATARTSSTVSTPRPRRSVGCCTGANFGKLLVRVSADPTLGAEAPADSGLST